MVLATHAQLVLIASPCLTLAVLSVCCCGQVGCSLLHELSTALHAHTLNNMLCFYTSFFNVDTSSSGRLPHAHSLNSCMHGMAKLKHALHSTAAMICERFAVWLISQNTGQLATSRTIPERSIPQGTTLQPSP